MTRYWVSFVFLISHLFLFSSFFFVFPYPKLNLLDPCILPTTLWELNTQHTFYLFPAKCCFQPSCWSLPNNKSVFLLNKSQVLFRIGKIRLFELTSSAGQWIHIWVVHANRECCHQWGASYVRVIQLHSHKNTRQKVSSQISTVFDDTEYGHTVRKSTPFLEQGSALWTNILKINPILKVFSWSLIEICTTSFPLAFYHWSLAVLLGASSSSCLFIFWAIIFSGASISHFSFSIKKSVKGWEAEREQ